MAINSADRNPYGAGFPRRGPWGRRMPWVSVGAGALCGLAFLGGGCSKGGAPDLNGCVKLSDPLPGDTSAPPARANYALLRSTSGYIIPVPLESGYLGTHTFTQCDQLDSYTVDKVVFVDKQHDPFATITPTNTGSGGSYAVAYANGQKALATGALFNNTISFTDPMLGPPVTLQGLTISTVSPMMASQGDLITIQATMMGSPCAIRDSQWWLAMDSVATPLITALQPIAGGAGSVTLRIPPTAATGVYYLAGQVTLSSGRTFVVKRAVPSDLDSYALFDGKGTLYAVMPKVPVAMVMVMAKADVETVAPQVVSIAVSPASPVRCGQLNLTLHLNDGPQPLPAGQQVKVWLGQASHPNLFSTMVVGSEYLSGTVQLPLDAPSGVWYAWPEVVRDAVGNEARATFALDGTFTLTGQGPMAKPIPAATFTVASTSVELPDAAVHTADLAIPVDLGGQPDMATPLPALLTGIKMAGSVTPDKVKGGESVNIYVTWTDNANLILQ